MQTEEKREEELASGWGFRLWGGLLTCLVLLWFGWGLYTWLASQRPHSQHTTFVKKKDGTIKKLVWKHPHYETFTNFSEVLKEAKKRKKPIFLDLYADWCVPCKKLEKQTFSHPTVHPVMAKYLVVKFNVDKAEGQRLSRKFRVRFYPTTLMLNSDGKVIERVIGFYPPRYYKPALVSVLEGRGFYRDLLLRNRRDPKDLKVTLKLAARSILRRRIPQARGLFKHVWESDKSNKLGVGAWGLFGYARSFSCVNKCSQAVPHLKTFHQLYPQKSKAQREVLRLQIYCYQRMRRNPERKAAESMFQRNFPGLSNKFK